MKKEDIQNIIKSSIDEALKPINQKLEAFEKQEEINTLTATNSVNEDEINQIFTDTIAKALEPINQRLEDIEKAKGISKQQQSGLQEVSKSIFSNIEI